MYTSKICFNKPLKCLLFFHIWGLFEMGTELDIGFQHVRTLCYKDAVVSRRKCCTKTWYAVLLAK